MGTDHLGGLAYMEDNIKMYVKRVGYDGMAWIRLARSINS
jgi:hypothetical protein